MGSQQAFRLESHSRAEKSGLQPNGMPSLTTKMVSVPASNGLPASRAIYISAFALAFLVVIPVRALLLKPTPVSADSSASRRGAELFATRGCAHCHGPNGVNGEIGPDLQQVRNRLKAPAIAAQIHNGSKGMPAFGDQLTAPQIDDLVAYLRTKRKVIIHPTPIAPLTPTAPEPE